MKAVGIIPARYASTRFPGKPLIEIAGKSMIQRVYERASLANHLEQVVVATDDHRIAEHVRQFGGDVCLTSSDHPTGTDRCYEALRKLEADFDLVINIQGDEPFTNPNQLDLLVGRFKEKDTQIATLVKKISNRDILLDQNKVKVVLDNSLRALYFSRAAIPHFRGKPDQIWLDFHDYYQHIGVYAYRSSVLAQITELEQSALEKSESLEQLRWLENGFIIRVGIVEDDAICIDTPDDVELALDFLKSHPEFK